MTEKALLNYFLSKVSVEDFSKDLQDSQVKTSYDTTSVYVIPISRINDEEYNVTRDNLIQLCNDTLNAKLTLTDINTIAFAIITSEFFTWDDTADDAEIIETVIYDWDNPEIGFSLSLHNIALWKQ